MDTPRDEPDSYSDFKERPIYEALADIGRAIASPIRLRLLDALQNGPRTVEDLSNFSGVPLKNTSAQLQRLRETQLVTSTREGTRMHYRLANGVEVLLSAFEQYAETNVARVRDEVTRYFADVPPIDPLTAEELAQRIVAEQITVIDVRPREECLRGHIEGAISIPLPELADRLSELDNGSPIVAYCDGPYCLASPRASHLLREAGLPVRTLKGGFAAWERRDR